MERGGKEGAGEREGAREGTIRYLLGGGIGADQAWKKIGMRGCDLHFGRNTVGKRREGASSSDSGRRRQVRFAVARYRHWATWRDSASQAEQRCRGK